MSTKLEKTSLSGQVYILTRLVEYLVKCSYYTMSSEHDTLRGMCTVRAVFCPASRDANRHGIISAEIIPYIAINSHNEIEKT